MKKIKCCTLLFLVLSGTSNASEDWKETTGQVRINTKYKEIPTINTTVKYQAIREATAFKASNNKYIKAITTIDSGGVTKQDYNLQFDNDNKVIIKNENHISHGIVLNNKESIIMLNIAATDLKDIHKKIKKIKGEESIFSYYCNRVAFKFGGVSDGILTQETVTYSLVSNESIKQKTLVINETNTLQSITFQNVNTGKKEIHFYDDFVKKEDKTLEQYVKPQNIYTINLKKEVTEYNVYELHFKKGDHELVTYHTLNTKLLKNNYNINKK